LKPTTRRQAPTRALYRRNAWKTLARQVVREEPICWLRLPGCTIRSTTADHIIPVSQRSDLLLVRANCRGACRPCNTQRHSTPVSQLPALRGRRQRAPALALFDGSK
jgi:5-methylcytosine-specific restriction endonuclease McrA